MLHNGYLVGKCDAALAQQNDVRSPSVHRFGPSASELSRLTLKLSSRGSLTKLVVLANQTRLPRSAAALC